jgi:hypothetical protein
MVPLQNVNGRPMCNAACVTWRGGAGSERRCTTERLKAERDFVFNLLHPCAMRAVGGRVGGWVGLQPSRQQHEHN